MQGICGFCSTFLVAILHLSVSGGALLSPARLNRVKTLLSKTECEASREPAGSEPIPVWPLGPRLLWKKHHARKERTLCKQPSGGAATPSLSLTPQPLFSPTTPDWVKANQPGSADVNTPARQQVAFR